MPARPDLRAVEDCSEVSPTGDTSAVDALARSAAFVDQQAAACEDSEVAAFLQCRAADIRLELFAVNSARTVR